MSNEIIQAFEEEFSPMKAEIDKQWFGTFKAGYEAGLASQEQQPPQEPTEPKLSQRLIDTFQELNMGNYGDDDVSQLNNWAIEVYMALASITQQQSQAQQPEVSEPMKASIIFARTAGMIADNRSAELRGDYPVWNLNDFESVITTAGEKL